MSSASHHHHHVHRLLFYNKKNTSNQIDPLLSPKSQKFDQPIKPFVVYSSQNMKSFVSKVAVVGSGSNLSLSFSRVFDCLFLLKLFMWFTL